MNKNHAFLVAIFLGAGAFACGGSSSSSNATTGGEQDITGDDGGACAPIDTLTCAPGDETTEDGCASPRIAGGPTYGRCVPSAGKNVIGTWTNAPGDEDDLLFYTITFDADGTYDATGGCRPNPNGPSCFAITHATGTWTVVKSGPQLGAPGGADELELVDSFGQKSDYFFSVEANQLLLSTVYAGKQSVFTQQ